MGAICPCCKAAPQLARVNAQLAGHRVFVVAPVDIDWFSGFATAW